MDKKIVLLMLEASLAEFKQDWETANAKLHEIISMLNQKNSRSAYTGFKEVA